MQNIWFAGFNLNVLLEAQTFPTVQSDIITAALSDVFHGI